MTWNLFEALSSLLPIHRSTALAFSTCLLLLSPITVPISAQPESGTIPILGWDLNPILRTGTPAPGEAELRVDYISRVLANDLGQVALLVRLVDPSSSALRFMRIYFWDQGQLSRVSGVANIRSLVSFNDRGTLAVSTTVDSLIVANRNRVLYEVNLNDEVPSEGDLSFDRLYGSALDNRNRLYFSANLSDGREGLFRADGKSLEKIRLDGDPIPGTNLSYPNGTAASGGIRAGDDFVIALTGNRILSIVRYDESGGHPLFVQGPQQLPGVNARYLDLEDVDEAGRVLFTVNSSHLFLADQGDLTSLVNVEEVEEFRDRESLLDGASFDARGVLFGVAFNSESIGGGIYRVIEGKIQKVIADGDLSPWGDSLRVTRDFGWDVPLRFLHPYLSTSSGDVIATGSHRLIVSDGNLTPIGSRDGKFEFSGSTYRISVIHREHAGRILLEVTSAKDRILVEGEAAASRDQLIPFLAHLETGSNRFESTIEVRNLSPLLSTVRVEGFNVLGTPISAPQDFLLGSFGRVDLGPGASDLPAASLRITSSNGARVAARAQLRQFDADTISSRAELNQRKALREFHFLTERTPGATTALALKNPSEAPLEVTLSSFDEPGRSLGQATLPIAARSLATLYAEPAIGAGAAQSARLEITATAPIHVTAFSQLGKQLVQLPDYTDPAPDWGFKTRFPSTSNGARDSISIGTHGEVAFGSFEHGVRGVWLIDEDGTRLIYQSSIPNSRADVQSVNVSSQVLVRTEPNYPEGPVHFLVWTGQRTEKVFTVLDSRLVSTRGNVLTDSGRLITTGSEVWIVGPEGERLVWERGDPPAAAGPWTRVSWVREAADGAVFLAGTEAIGRFEGTELSILYRRENLPDRPGNLVSFGLDEFALVEDELIFTGSWRGASEGGGGLYRLLEPGMAETLIKSGDSLPGKSNLRLSSPGSLSQSDGQALFSIRVIESESQTEMPAILNYSVADQRLDTALALPPTTGIEWVWDTRLEEGAIVFRGRQFDGRDGIWYWDGVELDPIFLEGSRIEGEGRDDLPVSAESVSDWFYGEGKLIVDARTSSGRAILSATRHGQRRVVPFLVAGNFSGVDYSSSLRFSNADATESHLRLRVRDFQGRTVRTDELTLSSRESKVISLDQDAPLIGWMDIDFNGSVESELVIRYKAPNQEPARVFLPGQGLLMQTLFPAHLRNEVLILANPLPQPVEVVLELLGRDHLMRSETLAIPALAQVFWVPEQSRMDMPEKGGALSLTSPRPIAVLLLSLEDGILTRIRGQ